MMRTLDRELPDTAAAVRLSGLEMADAIEEVSLLGCARAAPLSDSPGRRYTGRTMRLSGLEMAAAMSEGLSARDCPRSTPSGHGLTEGDAVLHWSTLGGACAEASLGCGEV